MPPRSTILFALLFGLLATGVRPGFGAADTTGDQTLRNFRDWTTACTKQGGGCTANTFILNEVESSRFDYRLTVSRIPTGDGYRLSFASPALGLDASKAIALRVDNNKTLSLTPETGFAPEPGVSDSALIANTEALSGLIRQMRKGNRMRVGFTDRLGRPQTIGFSLMGVTAALAHIGSRQGTVDTGAAAGAPKERTIVSVPAAEDWSERLADFLPAMRRCLVATPGGPSTVTRAWPMDGAVIGVRTRGPDGQRWDCFVAGGAPAVATFDAVPAEDQGLPGEAAPLFTPPGQNPPDDNCSRNERARDDGGDFVGWLSYRSC